MDTLNQAPDHPAPQTDAVAAAVAVMSDSDRLYHLRLSAEGFAEGDTLSAIAQSEAIKALSGATFEQWEGARTAWLTAYQSARAERNSPVDEKTAGKAWQRLVSGAGLEKPKSTAPAAKAKSATRERNEAAERMLANLSDEAIAESVESLRPFAADGMSRAVERMATLKAEQSRRNKAREDAESQATKSLRAECAELLKTAPHETLALIRAILKGEVEINMPEGDAAPDIATVPMMGERTGTEG